MSREEADALARKLLATYGQHTGHIPASGEGVLAETTPEARAFYEQYFIARNEDRAMNNELTPEDIAFYEDRKQKKTAALKALRVTINTAIAAAKTVAEAEFMHGAGVDELAHAIHNLKQARMWAGEALGEIGHKLPPEYRDDGKAVPNKTDGLLSVKELAQRFGNRLQEVFGRGLVEPVLVYPDQHPAQAEVYYALKPAVLADVDNS